MERLNIELSKTDIGKEIIFKVKVNGKEIKKKVNKTLANKDIIH